MSTRLAMREPKNYDLKKWLCQHKICGLKLYYYSTGIESAQTDWELETTTGEKRRVKDSDVRNLVEVNPDWAAVLKVKDIVYSEVKQWDAYVEEESADLKEYERLKKKFNDA